MRASTSSPPVTGTYWWRIAVFTLLLSPLIASAQYAGPAPTEADVTSTATHAKQDTKVLDELLNTKPVPVQIATGDIIEVHIFNVKAYEMKGRVSADGTAIFPLLGPLHIAGLTVEKLEDELRTKLEEGGMIRNPQLNVVVTESPSQRATVSGEVNKPGTFPVNGDHTLIQLISMAEGLKDTASHTVVLYRTAYPDGISVQLGPDPRFSRYSAIPIFAGDTVIVSKVGVLYVVGAVKTSGTYPLKDTTPTTLVQAITMAGGPGFEAETQDIRIVRGAGTDKQQEIRVNYDKVIHGKIKDPVLQADDILLLPTDKMKAAVKGGGAGLAVSLATALLYLH